MSMKHIPMSWCQAKLGEIADQITKGTTPTTAGYQYLDTGIPFIKIENINQYGVDLNSVTQFISEEANKALLRSQFQEGDILFSIAGTIGKTALITKECLPANTNQAVAIIRGTSVVFDAKYLRQQLRNSADTIARNNARGGAMNNISLGDLKNITLSIPSFAEQQQIAAKLDELLAQVDSIKTRLDAIPKILKRFRQSVLAAAVSGKLTEEWRGKHQIDLKTWKLLKVGDVVEKIEAGKNLKCIEVPPVGDEKGIIKISAVTWGIFAEEESKTLPLANNFIEERRIKTGDFLISRANTLELLGNPVIVHKITKNLMLSDKVLRLVMSESDKPWVCIFLRSTTGRKEIESRSTGNQLSMRNIGQKALLDIDIPKPTIEEQTEIVHRVEQLFTYADQIEQRVKDTQARVNHLTQSILARAFLGELTADWRAQNPDLISGENSAEALLEKIRAKREAVKTKKPKKERGDVIEIA